MWKISFESRCNRDITPASKLLFYSSKEAKQMKLLLHADVPDLGHFGDVVEVKTSYARNYLIPQRIAVQPTEENIKAIEAERAQKAEERRLAQAALAKAAEKVADAEITVTGSANDQGHLYGSVTEQHVAEALQKDGYDVQTKHVVMAEHFTMLGSYSVTLKFSKDLTTNIKVWVVRPEGETGEFNPDPETDLENDHGSESETDPGSELEPASDDLEK